MLRRTRFGWIDAALSVALLATSVGAQFGDLSGRPTTTPATAPTTAPATTAPAAGLKPAENAEHGFRVSIPPTWEERPVIAKGAALVLAPVGSRPPRAFEVRPNWLAIVSTDAKVQAGGDIDAVAARTMANVKVGFEEVAFEEVEDVKLGGATPAKRIRYAGDMGKQRVQGDTTVALKDGKLFALTGMAPVDEFEAHRQAFDQILASFAWTGGGGRTEEKDRKD